MGRKHKKGDTLVEVSLAIGIFSMVAIAAVSVINGSTTGAQASLESTITREELDGQAEALRFIQSAYVAGGEINESNPTKYASLWQTISDHAIDLTGLSNSDRDLILKYNPVSCDSLYNSSASGWGTLQRQKAFVINTRAMSSSDPSDIVVDYNSSIFRAASTYPRIVYNGVTSDALYNASDTASAFSVTSAEGLYVIAVRDEDGTAVVSDSSGGSTTIKSAYIDFYIRSCWFTPSAERASTISTVIRLYDPDAIAINKYQRKGTLIRYGGNGASTGAMAQQYIYAGESGTILENQFAWPGHRFKYWTTKANGTGTRYNPGDKYSVSASLSTSNAVTLYAQWETSQINLVFNANGGSGNMASQTIPAGTSQKINANAFTRSGYTFSSWNTNSNGTGTKYDNTATFTASASVSSEQTVTLYAQWAPVQYTLTYDANNGNNAPNPQSCPLSTIQKCYVASGEPTRSGYKFLGWADSASATSAKYSAGNEVAITGSKTLYAVWQSQSKTIRVTLEWKALDNVLSSYVSGQKSNGGKFIASAENKLILDGDGSIIANLEESSISNLWNNCKTFSFCLYSGSETFVINAAAGKKYYYYVQNYASFAWATVTVYDAKNNATSYSSQRTKPGFWEVFSYKDGAITSIDSWSSQKPNFLSY